MEQCFSRHGRTVIHERGQTEEASLLMASAELWGEFPDHIVQGRAV